MRTRVLPPEEWPRLAGTAAATIWPQLTPAFTDVLVVERDGQIVGSVVLLSVLHAECLTNHGGPGVARALYRALQQHVQGLRGGGSVWGAATDARMARLLTTHAQPIPGTHFIVPLGGPCRPQ